MLNKVFVFAYVLMTNHVHILSTTGDAYSTTYPMQDVGRKYVRYINHTYRCTDTLWERRFKANLVDTLLGNPVRPAVRASAGVYYIP